MTTLPNREVGDDGHVDDHNNIAAAIASLEAALPVAQNAAASATAAAASAASASSSATSAGSSASSASTSEANALLYSQQAAAGAAAVANVATNAYAVEAAKDAALDAQTAAETAQAAAETAEAGADTSATAAAGSASTASTQASNAAASATAAASSATAAAASESAAGTSESNAASSASAASASATAASGSASAAAASESAAAASEAASESWADSAAASAASVNATEFRQFAADGSVLANLPARVHPAEQLLKQAVWWIDAAHSSASGQTVSNLGWGGSALDAQCGSTGSADSNDPKYLDWQGENYVYLPGVAGNYLSVPDEAALDITGDIDIRCKAALADWTPSTANAFVSKRVSGSSQIAYYFYLATSGKLVLLVGAAGGTTTVDTEAVADSTVTPTVSDGETLWVRATMDVDDGAGNHIIRYYTSADGSSWTQLGADVTVAGTVSINVSTADVTVGSALSSLHATGSFYRAQVLDGIDGTTVLDVDCSQITSGSDTSFTALTGQTVTINRSTSGRKTVGVVHPRWLFGTDDYMEVADNDLIDFGASDSFTVLAVVRQWATPTATTQRLLSKKPTDSVDAGYMLFSSTSPYVVFDLGDNSIRSYDLQSQAWAGQLSTVTGVRDVGADTITAAVDGTGTPTTDATTGSLANSKPLRVGALGGGGSGGYADMEFTAAAIWRRALTAGEIATLNSYFQGRDA